MIGKPIAYGCCHGGRGVQNPLKIDNVIYECSLSSFSKLWTVWFPVTYKNYVLLYINGGKARVEMP